MTKKSLKADPTRTTLLRKRFMTEATRRIRVVQRAVRDLILLEDELGIKQVRNVRKWRAETLPDKVAKFEEWLQGQVERKIQRRDKRGRWVEGFITDAYVRGAKRGYNDVRRRTDGFLSGDKREAAEREFLRSTILGDEIKRNRLKALQARTFRDIKGVTDKMVQQMTDELTEGLMRGDSATKLARELTRRIPDMTINQAHRIARTEVVRAHAEGVLDALEGMGVTKITVAVEWDTADDAKVCPLCKPLDGLVLPLAKARGMFPRHPNCRCSPIPVEPEPYELHKAKIRAAVDRSVLAEIPKSKRRRRKSAKQQRRRSRWVGARRR